MIVIVTVIAIEIAIQTATLEERAIPVNARGLVKGLCQSGKKNVSRTIHEAIYIISSR